MSKMEKDGMLLVLIAGIMVLYPGCIGVTYDQQVSPNGTSMVTQETDMSGLIVYMENLSASMSAVAMKAPDLSYRASDYASLPSFESAATDVDISEMGKGAADSFSRDSAAASFSNMTPGKIVYVSVSIHNSGNYSLNGMKVRLLSDAVVPYSYPMEEGAGTLASGGYHSILFAADVANVTSGTYYMTAVAVFETQSYDPRLEMMTKKNVTVAKTIGFTVNPIPPSQKPDYESQFSGLCTNITRVNPGVTCSYSNGKLTVAKNIQPDGKNYSFSSENGLFETDYSVDITAPPNIVSTSEISGNSGTNSLSSSTGNWTGKFSDGFPSGASAAMIKSIMTMEYVVHMPAKIENYTAGGELSDDGKTVTYDAMSLYDKKRDIHITAKEGDPGKMYLIIGGAVLLVLIMVFVLPMLGAGKKQEKYEI